MKSHMKIGIETIKTTNETLFQNLKIIAYNHEHQIDKEELKIIKQVEKAKEKYIKELNKIK